MPGKSNVHKTEDKTKFVVNRIAFSTTMEPIASKKLEFFKFMIKIKTCDITSRMIFRPSCHKLSHFVEPHPIAPERDVLYGQSLWLQ